MAEKRAIILLLDGVGVGELPDAHLYNDQGSNTLKNLSEKIQNFHLPNLEKLGLGNIIEIQGVKRIESSLASYGKMAELSPGKDSTSGHWELMGVVLKHPFPVYPKGFPKEIISKFEKIIGKKVLGNIPASGTEIINRFGEEHLRTGYPIVYTSADSVFQIAAHENVITPQELYKMCEVARKLLRGKHSVLRVIARPFIGRPGHFTRTSRRKDFSLSPPELTLLDIAKDHNYEVVVIGKVDELFANQGFTNSFHSVNNMECFDYTLKAIESVKSGIIFTNFIQFDMDWGHRNDCQAFYQGLLDFDTRLPEVLRRLREDDILFITADHGNDPTTPSTDHSREYVPVLVYGKKVRSAVNLGTRKSFADVGQTIAEYLQLPQLKNGISFWKKIEL
ncbi:MAG: phosphopentomutase [candidate division WOR-3 bacterium]|nr:phosphopentomutase [candidate division WOR-3 bacterium]